MTLKNKDFNLEIKAINEDGFFSGYGSIFGNKDSYGDVVVKGAFSKTLSEWAKKGMFPPMLWQHDKKQPIGAFLKMEEDDKGLYLEGKLLLDVQQGREAYSMLKNKVISGLSIGYNVEKGNWNDLNKTYELEVINLWEVSLVTYPANTLANVETVKSALACGQLPSLKEFEKSLIDLGFSQKQAEIMAVSGLQALAEKSDKNITSSDEEIAVKSADKLLDFLNNLTK